MTAPRKDRVNEFEVFEPPRMLSMCRECCHYKTLTPNAMDGTTEFSCRFDASNAIASRHEPAFVDVAVCGVDNIARL